MIGDLIYQPLKGSLLSLLKAPKEPPEPPAGSHASVEVFRASPKFLRYRLLFVSLGALVPLAILLGGALAGSANEQSKAFVLALVIAVLLWLVLVLIWFGVRVDYDLRYYILTDRSLRVREGAFIVREQTLTYANVQNLDRHQGPLQRLFGISDLRVDTAGGGVMRRGEHTIKFSHGATIAGVENAPEIAAKIRGHLRGRGDSGLGDPDDARGGAPQLAATPEVLASLRALADEARALRAAAEGATGQ